MMRSGALVRLLVAWIAILAYGAPGAVHALVRGAALTPSAVEDCELHGRGADAPAAAMDYDRAPVAHREDGGSPRGGPSLSCCVAMCTPALPGPVSQLPLTQEVRVPLLQAPIAALDSGQQLPLDRPPKP